MKKRTTDDLVMIGARVPADLRAKARHVALDEGISLRELLERALREYITQAKARRKTTD